VAPEDQLPDKMTFQEQKEYAKLSTIGIYVNSKTRVNTSTSSGTWRDLRALP